MILLVFVLVSACTGDDAATAALSTTAGDLVTTTTAMSAASTAPVQPEFTAGVWARVPHDEVVFGGADSQRMRSVVAGGPGLVAVGYDGPGGDWDAAVWTSPDGLTWARVPHDEAVFGGTDSQRMWSVATGGPGLVAVGYDGPGGDWDAAAWTSPDGLTWARVPHDEAVFGGDSDQWIVSVVAGGPGLVAVGYDSTGGDWDAAVWTSPDGLTWARVPHDEAVFGGTDSQRMWSVATGGPGLVAVGYDSTGSDGDPAVWTSPDGLTWARVPHDEAVFGGGNHQEMRSVVAVGLGVVVVGFDGSADDWDAAVWTSPDGLTWARVPHDEAVFGGGNHQEMRSVVAVGSRLVAVGYDYSGGDRDAAVWYWTPNQ